MLFVYVMPIVWSVISVPIGIALYKTSVALYMKGKEVHTESEQEKAKKVKQFLLGGSAAISALAFIGMMKGTMALRDDESKRATLRTSAKAVRKNSQDMQACFSSSPGSCSYVVNANDAVVSDLERALTAFDE